MSGVQKPSKRSMGRGLCYASKHLEVIWIDLVMNAILRLAVHTERLLPTKWHYTGGTKVGLL